MYTLTHTYTQLLTSLCLYYRLFPQKSSGIHIYIYVYIHYKFVCIYIDVYIYTHTYAYTKSLTSLLFTADPFHKGALEYTYMHVHYYYTYLFVFTCTYMHTHSVCTLTYTHMYIYTHTRAIHKIKDFLSFKLQNLPAFSKEPCNTTLFSPVQKYPFYICFERVSGREREREREKEKERKR